MSGSSLGAQAVAGREERRLTPFYRFVARAGCGIMSRVARLIVLAIPGAQSSDLVDNDPDREALPTLRALRHARRALASTWVSSRGEYVARVAERLAQHLRVKNVLLVNSGTAATHLLSFALRFRHPEVTSLYVPNNAYVAAWNAFLSEEPFELRPIDADLATWNVAEDTLRGCAAASDEHAAFVVVHNLGNVVNVPALKRAYQNRIFVEDCCEALFGQYEGAFAGTKGLAGSISFFGSKAITAGEGRSGAHRRP